MNRLLFSFLFVAIHIASTYSQSKITTLQVPGTGQYCQIDPAGASVLPSGRYVTPAGKVSTINRAPYGLAVSSDQQIALVLHNEVVTVVDLRNNEPVRIPSYDGKIPPVVEGSSFMGIAFEPGSHRAWLSGGDKGTVVLFDADKKQKLKAISIDVLFGDKQYEDSYISDIAFDGSRNQLLALDRANNRLVKIDLQTEKIAASIKVGRIPFGISLSPDGSKAFVANVGLFEYPLVPGVTPQNKDSLMLEYAAYGYPSKEAEEGVVLPDGRKVPGLGSPLAPEAMSVWVVDLENNIVTHKLKTGYQIGELIDDEEVVGGAHPNSVAVGKRFAYVTNASNDLVAIIDTKKGRIIDNIPLVIHPKLDEYRGLMPFGLALSPDEKKLYVACLSLNAVAVIDVKKKKVEGYIPTGWMPTRVKVSNDGKKIFITSARGYGAGPNGGKGFVTPPQGTYIGDIQLGAFQIVDLPDAGQLAMYTRQVVQNTFREVVIDDNGSNPLPPLPGLRKSPIRHIVYVTKENRTFDEVLGQLPQGKGDASLARFGEKTVVANGINPLNARPNVNVMPNHLKIARQFAFSDNFYCDSDASIHGHHWMVGTIPNEYVEANSQVSAEFKPFSSAPGRRFPRTTGAMDPEDYNERGGLWENLDRHRISFYNFGQANEYTGSSEEWYDTLFGARHSVVFPLPEPLFDRTSRHYPGYNMNVPDQYRMDQFEEEFTRRWLNGKDTMPQLITMILPNDHGQDPRPEAGYPYLQSYMADNDLALGRLLHFLSRTPYWENMLVIITEDDPQGGVDHIDAHRSLLLLAGPYVKRGYVSNTHANFGSLLKTLYNLLNIDYVNHYDLTASLLQDFFTDRPDFTPYTLDPADSAIFVPQKALDIYKRTFNWEKIMQGPKLDNENEQRKSFYEQHKND